jgi:ABC-type phosphate/phosphonate transport system substrate-binding protein
MIASLPMYHRPELAADHALLWQLIRAGLQKAGIGAPEHLSQNAAGVDTWLNPSLVFSQTCGMPYRLKLHGKTTLIGTPDYGVQGCPPGYYRSAFIVHKNDARQQLTDYRDALFAYNEKLSQSGYAAAQVTAATQGFTFENMFLSGAHRNSARIVADGIADIAALDAVTWRLIRQYDDMAAELRVLCWSTPTPGLPYITRQGADAAVYFSAVAEAIAALPPASRQILGLRGLVAIPARHYLAIPNP